MEAEFKRLAEFFIATMRANVGVELGYDESSVEWADGFVERQRERFRDDATGLVNVVGSFLGECVIANFGGRWSEHETGGWGVLFDAGTTAFPFAKVSKQFANGREGGDSIHSFYTTIPVILRSLDDVD
ncbi:MAG TPA: hypothetical protein VER32_10985 [Pyrinomonadaceae bacterium]|nr:hypothetical protein [Pyrinomonadaceae bacterium]